MARVITEGTSVLDDGPYWTAIIILEPGDDFQSVGYIDTGEVGLPSPGYAVATPDRRTIYVRSGNITDNPKTEEVASQVYKIEEWHILQPLHTASEIDR